MTTTALLSTENLQASVAGRVICRNLSLNVRPGERWAILGINGIGKTTLLHTLAGLRQPDRGTIHYRDRPLTQYSSRSLAKQRGLLFQDKADPFPATVMETVLIGRHPYIENWQWESANDIDRARQALQQVGLASLEKRTINTLSGGERQRVAIATLLAQQPRVLLLDEPTNHLDIHHQMQVMQLVNDKVSNQQSAAIMILHDMNTAARFCDHVLMMFDEGDILQGTTGELLTAQRLESLYGHPIRQLTTDTQTVFIPG